ncbi:class I SAM-dependent methyltransferase [uncultured Enterovirga sp.]|uniref:class I SAM-dependent methyltransferase n=1 Tax=uncultured Enterovirga sp. TaxID=2026352 RepID=UPI0035CBB9F3
MSAALSEPQPFRQSPSRRPIAAIADELGYSPDWNWSWNSYKAMVVRLSEEYGLTRHLEIGGGRDTLFTPEEAERLGLSVTINDISAGELALAPAAFAKICCDVAAPDTMQRVAPGSYDLVYSRMVMEHVRDARRLWQNQYAMLAPGGVALAFVPTLYAPAFALNRLVPEAVSSAIVSRLFPDRHQEGDNPKFPAFYDHCFGDPAKVVPMLEGCGYRETLVLPFYGYSYFWKIPVLRQVDAAFTRLTRERDWRRFTSFAYIMAVK